MTKEGFSGICLQLAGRINQAWGELSGDPLRAAAGRRDQNHGKAQQAGAVARAQAARQLNDFRHSHRNWYF